MQVRFMPAIAIGLLAFYGCASEPEQKPAANASGTAAAPAKAAPAQDPRSYRTGSRLPTRDDDVGASSVGNISKDDYIHDRNSSVSPMSGQ